MKLLIVTQVMDSEHPILGFFHRWVEEFSEHCEQVHVICLQEGKHNLPSNITVHSLGKDEGKGRLTYLWRFYKLIWQLRHDYDNVFVHMNQIYVILGAPFWRVLGKKVGLWYAHGAVTSSLKLAVALSHKVFTSTAEGMIIDSPKRTIVGQGIDLKLFHISPRVHSDILSLITVGRVSKSKNIDTLLRACSELKKKNIKFNFKIIGLPTTPGEEVYTVRMKELTIKLGLEHEVDWVGPVHQKKLPNELQKADIFIHDGSTNSLDKTLLEAVLCGCVVVSSNPAYRCLSEELTPDLLYKPKEVSVLTNIIQQEYIISVEERKNKMKPIRGLISSKYSVSNLISGIIAKY